ncbi:hypothetical protein SCLCIDRAFT_1219997 [Scleroderma citrinum Foug A]|uniref:Uncharacterized protein n=1 Tax=Scleroderma citrinum Foug A TaxID=1036808 RepID=A0A0C3DKZ2_9AGAM|nr:hypothetical protein SCLCIDRAFT_1219997 [Scleroderma citrinum Foug A]
MGSLGCDNATDSRTKVFDVSNAGSTRGLHVQWVVQSSGRCLGTRKTLPLQLQVSKSAGPESQQRGT